MLCQREKRPSLPKLEGKKLFLKNLADRVYVPDKTSLKMNGAEDVLRAAVRGVPY
jgi:hypothetical protein